MDAGSFQRKAAGAFSLNDQSVILRGHGAAHRGQILRDSPDPVRFLHLEFRRIPDAGRSLCSGCHHRDHRDLVDQRGDQGSSEGDAVKRSIPDQKVGGGLGVIADIVHGDIGAHTLSDFDHARPCGIDPDIADQHLGSGDQGSNCDKISCGRDVSRDDDPAAGEAGAGRCARMPAVTALKGVDLRSEGAQHSFRVIS